MTKKKERKLATDGYVFGWHGVVIGAGQGQGGQGEGEGGGHAQDRVTSEEVAGTSR
jgi:hypothetical protein